MAPVPFGSGRDPLEFFFALVLFHSLPVAGVNPEGTLALRGRPPNFVQCVRKMSPTLVLPIGPNLSTMRLGPTK
jgi:hypothetical protein